MSPYPWIPTEPVGRSLPLLKPSRQARATCPRCGYDWVGRRKKCPACLVRQERTDAA